MVLAHPELGEGRLLAPGELRTHPQQLGAEIRNAGVVSEVIAGMVRAGSRPEESSPA